MKKENTNAHRDSGDINFSSEPKGKAHAFTKLPFGFEGRTIFHWEPRQNFRDVQRLCSLSESPLKAGRQSGRMGRLPARISQEGSVEGWADPLAGLGVRAIWPPLSLAAGLRAPFTDTASAFLQSPMLTSSSDSSRGPTSLHCLLGSS